MPGLHRFKSALYMINTIWPRALFVPLPGLVAAHSEVKVFRRHNEASHMHSRASRSQNIWAGVRGGSGVTAGPVNMPSTHLASNLVHPHLPPPTPHAPTNTNTTNTNHHASVTPGPASCLGSETMATNSPNHSHNSSPPRPATGQDVLMKTRPDNTAATVLATRLMALNSRHVWRRMAMAATPPRKLLGLWLAPKIMYSPTYKSWLPLVGAGLQVRRPSLSTLQQ